MKFLASASLKNYGKNRENFSGYLNYDTKHWALAPKTEICFEYFLDKNFQK